MADFADSVSPMETNPIAQGTNPVDPGVTPAFFAADTAAEYDAQLQQYTEEAQQFEDELNRKEQCEAWWWKAAGIMSFLAYITLSTIAFGLWEDWSAIDALYFVIVTISTVGYGDLVPDTEGARIFTVFFMVLGLLFFALSLGYLSAEALDTASDAVGMDARVGDLSIEEPAKTTYCKFFFLVLLLIAIPMAGTVFYFIDEDWDFVTAFYMSFTTCTTVGYGDFSPQTEHGRLFAIFWLVVGVTMVGNALSEVAGLSLTKNLRIKQKRRLMRPISGKVFANFSGRDHKLDVEEFTILKLLAQGKINEKDLNRCATEFRKINRHNKESLELEDVRAHFHGVRDHFAEHGLDSDQVVEQPSTSDTEQGTPICQLPETERDTANEGQLTNMQEVKITAIG